MSDSAEPQHPTPDLTINEDPGADTQMFRKFVAAQEEPSTPARTRAALIGGGVVLVALVGVMVWLLG